MNIWNSKSLANVLKSEVLKNQVISTISINSKKIGENCLFIPIKGERFNGHDFIGEAFRNGASLSLVEEKFISRLELSSELKKKLLIVDNTLYSMKILAKEARERANKLKMIGITGSSGKTTLKNWTSEILKQYFLTHKTIGNYNNQIGLTLSLSMMPKNTEIGVFELGMNQKDEINELTKIIKPNISIITNVAPAHIENFNSEIEIAEEKSCIFSGHKKGIAIIPSESKYFEMLKIKAEKNFHKVYTFGIGKNSDFQFLGLKKEKSTIRFKILGENFTVKNLYLANHFYLNISIIIGIAKLLKINLNNLKKQLQNLSPVQGRGSIHFVNYKKRKFTLIDDSYNSNPLSLEVSIKNLKTFYNYNRKICVIGDMLELGKQSTKFHLDVIKILYSEKIDIVYTIGKFSKVIFSNMQKKIICEHFNNLKSLENAIFSVIQTNDVILFKGSNSIGLSKICKKLMD